MTGSGEHPVNSGSVYLLAKVAPSRIRPSALLASTSGARSARSAAYLAAGAMHRHREKPTASEGRLPHTGATSVAVSACSPRRLGRQTHHSNRGGGYGKRDGEKTERYEADFHGHLTRVEARRWGQVYTDHGSGERDSSSGGSPSAWPPRHPVSVRLP